MKISRLSSKKNARKTESMSTRLEGNSTALIVSVKILKSISSKETLLMM